MDGLDRGVELLLNEGPQRMVDHPLAAPTQPSVLEARFALTYLDVFGYLAAELAGWTDIQLSDIKDAIKLFQGFFGLGESGDLSPATVRAMQVPRCGWPDIPRAHHEEYQRLRQAATANLAKWNKRSLTYCITDYLPGLTQAVQDQLAQQAFQNWCDLAQIDVRPGPQQSADIIISVGQGNRSQFDGPGGTLAWAYLPTGSDAQLNMRFDLDESWTQTTAQRGICYLNVACHEFGHLLGLDHSKVQGALMAPFYAAQIDRPQANDDIPRIQARYGPRQTPVPVPPPPTPTPGKNRIVIESDGIVHIALNDRVLA